MMEWAADMMPVMAVVGSSSGLVASWPGAHSSQQSNNSPTRRLATPSTVSALPAAPSAAAGCPLVLEPAPARAALAGLEVVAVCAVVAAGAVP